MEILLRYNEAMSKKLRKKRFKKYRPQDDQPTIHRYSAETEAKRAQSKSRKRKLLLLGIPVVLILLLLELLI